MTQAYPLQWPQGWTRIAPHKREDGRSRFARATGGSRWSKPVTLHVATQSLIDELTRLGAKHITISTNLVLRQDGLPRSGQKTPEDPGVAVYFEHEGAAVVMARDAFMRPEDNLRSLALAVEALRQMKRHGGGTMIKRAFTGFTALPPPEQMSTIVTAPPNNWWDVLGVSHDASWSEIKSAHRALVMKSGGGTVEVNAAYEAAKRKHQQ